MAGVAESSRQRIALVFAGVGLLLVLIGFGLLAHSQASIDSGALATRPSPIPPAVKARAIRQMLFWLIVLVLVFMVSTMAFLRWSRHYRRSLLRKPKEPTPSEDVWAMHKLPEGAVDDWTEDDAEDEDDDGDGTPPRGG